LNSASTLISPEITSVISYWLPNNCSNFPAVLLRVLTSFFFNEHTHSLPKEVRHDHPNSNVGWANDGWSLAKRLGHGGASLGLLTFEN